jgi:GST-like protein
MIDVYTANTPNGIKIPIALEELGVPYTLHKLDLAQNEQKQPEFLRINPNGRIPAIVDRAVAGGGEALSVIESGAILLYLADKYGALIPQDPVGRVRALEYLFFQVSGIGPMFGQAGWFSRNAPDVTVGLTRYQNESARLTAVLEHRLQESTWLAGDSYSIADVANFGWLRVAAGYLGMDMSAYPAVQRWVEAIEARPATRRALKAMTA